MHASDTPHATKLPAFVAYWLASILAQCSDSSIPRFFGAFTYSSLFCRPHHAQFYPTSSQRNHSMDRNETETSGYIAPKPVASEEGSLDHVLDVLASHRQPFLLVGCAAQRWMGSAGTMTDVCEIIIRHNTLKAVASDLLATERW